MRTSNCVENGRALRQAVFLSFVLPLMAAAAAPAADAARLIGRIKAVGGHGAGNEEAARAWGELVRLGPAVLPDLLTGLDDAGPIASNWLHSAVDAVAENALNGGLDLDARKLEGFVRDKHHAGASRRLAYEWLCRVDATAPGRLLPGMLDDPGAELRREAVAVAFQKARAVRDKGDKDATIAAYWKVFDAARDADQVNLAAKELQGLGVAVNLPAHFGFIQRWQLVGPFDNSGGVGFSKAYPPEQGVDAAATYEGKKGTMLRWKEHVTADPYGTVDLNTALGKNMGVVGYAFAVIDSPSERPVELRAGSNNAVKIFLNGKQVFFREEYHHGLRMDQHVGRGVLKAGRNEVLIKVCQNEQKDSWAQSWSFQLRVCDAIGGAVPFKVEPVGHESLSQQEKAQR